MEFCISTLLGLHVLSGTSALLTGLVAIVTRKGGKAHRRAGFVFFISMLGVGSTAIALALLRPNNFLLMVGIFSIYQAVGGYSSVRNKSLKPTVLDLVVWGIAIVNTVFMLTSWIVVLMVFGGISGLLVVRDTITYVTLWRGKTLPKLAWLRRHIGMMMGAYIATLTAFLVVNIDHAPHPWLPWLSPSLIGVPLIIFWSSRYRDREQPAPAKA